MKLYRVIFFVVLLLLAADVQADDSPEVFVENFYNRFYQHEEDEEYRGLRGAVRFVESLEPFLESGFYELMRESTLWDLSNQTFGWGNGLNPMPHTTITQIKAVRKEMGPQSGWVELEVSGTSSRRGLPVSAIAKVFLLRGGDHGWLISNVLLPEQFQARRDLKKILGNVPERGYAVQLLSPDELKTVRSERSYRNSIITNQSFSFAGTDTIYASQENAALFLAFAFEEAPGENSLRLAWRDFQGRYYDLIDDANVGLFRELKEVVFGDFNRDGLGPDILSIANYDNGRGGVQARAQVFFCQSPYEYRFKEDSQLAEYLSGESVRTVAEVESAILRFYEEAR